MARVRAFELLLTDKQRLISLLYLAHKVTAATLLARMNGAQEMSMLRLTEGDKRETDVG